MPSVTLRDVSGESIVVGYKNLFGTGLLFKSPSLVVHSVVLILKSYYRQLFSGPEMIFY